MVQPPQPVAHPTPDLDEEIRALEDGRAVVERLSFRIVEAAGEDARSWLGDLLTADVAGVPRGHATRSLLLSPTGRIRADVHLACVEPDRFLLLQDGRQPSPIDGLLAPYVLSSRVDLRARDDLRLWCAPGREGLAEAGDPAIVACALGGGFDLVLEAGAVPRPDVGERVGEGAIEAWRIRRGVPRFPADLDERSLPAEWPGLVEEAIDLEKGCFLGQESVAKVRRGRPPRVVLALRAVRGGQVTPGEPLLAGAGEVGAITSASRGPEGWAVLARVQWDARDQALSTAAGVLLAPAGTG